MRGLVGRITTWQIVPRSASAQNPKDTVQYRARILPRPAPPIVPAFRTEQWFENHPLGIGQVHALDLRYSWQVSTAQHVESVYEITSSDMAIYRQLLNDKEGRG
jgi:hypothetical protein